jgi:peptide/nickel transport system ATP-binding protein
MVDASLRTTIVNLFRALRDEMGVSIIYITHDLATAYSISDRVVIMRGGQVVEAGDARATLDNPQHPYSIELKNAVLCSTPSTTSSTSRCTPTSITTPATPRRCWLRRT